MAAKHTNSLELSDFDRLRKENGVLRDELVNLREEISGERHTHEQLLKSFQVCHNEDSRKLREEKKLTSKLAEENGELRLELKAVRERSSPRSPSDHDKKPLHEADVSSRLLKELSALGKRLGLLHNDLLSSPVAKNVDRRHSTKRGEIGISLYTNESLDLAHLSIVFTVYPVSICLELPKLKVILDNKEEIRVDQDNLNETFI